MLLVKDGRPRCLRLLGCHGYRDRLHCGGGGCAAAIKIILQPFEADHYDRDVIHGLLTRSKSQDFIGTLATDGVQALAEVALAVSNYRPHHVADLIGAQFVEDAIAPKNNEIDVLTAILKVGYIRVANDDTSHATEIRVFRLYVSEGSRDREPPRGHAVGSYVGIVLVLITRSDKLIDGDLLNHGCGHIALEDSLGLVDSAAVSNNSIVLARIHRLVVVR